MEKILGTTGLIAGALETLRDRYGLSPAEYEVAKLIVQGLTHIEIAEEFKKAPSTVNTQKSSILKKTGMHSILGLSFKVMRIMEELTPNPETRARSESVVSPYVLNNIPTSGK